MLLSLGGCGESNMSQSQFYSMNASVTVTAYGKNAKAGLSAAESVFVSLDAQLDPETPTSTVYTINHANGGSVVISGQMAKMIETAQTVYKRSGGAFDLTIYPLIELWGFVDNKFYVPTGVDILDKVGNLCFDKISLTSFPTSGTYTLTIPSFGEMTFASIARGSASDYAAEAMKNEGVTSGIIAMNGNVQTIGTQPDGSLWTVAIQDPEEPSTYLGTLKVGETSLSTTGPYQCRFTDISTGNVYHHILKPSSGYTISNTLLSVTVVSKNGALADSLATAMYVLGYTAALNYWRQYGNSEGEEFDLILVNNEKKVICTSGLIEQFTLTNNDYTLRFTE